MLSSCLSLLVLFAVARSSLACTDCIENYPVENYRVFGTVSPDEDGCYRDFYYDKRGEIKRGDYTECIVGEVHEKVQGSVQKYEIEATFTPFDLEEVTYKINCEVKVMEKDGLAPYNAKAKCLNDKNIQGSIVAPSFLGGEVRMNGKVDNTKFPERTYDFRWKITPDVYIATESN